MNIVKCRSMKKIKLFFLFILAVAFTACTDGDEGYSVVFFGDHFVRNWNLEESFPNMKTKNFGGKQNSGLVYFSQLNEMHSEQDAVILLGNSDLPQLAEAGTDVAISEYCDKFISYAKNLHSKNVYIYSFLPQNYSNDTTTKRMNEFIKKVNSILGPKVIAAGFTYIDVHADFYDGYSINPEYVIRGEIYNQAAYHLLAAKLLEVYK